MQGCSVLVACARIGHNFYCDSYVSMIPVTAGQYREQCEKEGIEVDDSYLSEAMDGVLGGYGEMTYVDIKSIHGRTREEFKDKLKQRDAELWRGYTKGDDPIECDRLEGVHNDRIKAINPSSSIPVTWPRSGK
ncbi:hypothetical protein [Pseudomonas phage vB_PaS-HSN4]|nr:hypothetical protein [Pseudomonas phage vB_PaS-HSN4]